jgi:hypothetical protein
MEPAPPIHLLLRKLSSAISVNLNGQRQKNIPRSFEWGMEYDNNDIGDSKHLKKTLLPDPRRRRLISPAASVLIPGLAPLPVSAWRLVSSGHRLEPAGLFDVFFVDTILESPPSV